MNNVFLLFSAVFLITCTSGQDRAREIIDRSIKAHGGRHFAGSRISFDFRDHSYSVERREDGYLYTRSFEGPEGQVTDYLLNSTELVRTLNGDTVILHDTMKTKYSNSVNSVLYFAQLPYVLNDEAVITNYLGPTSIKSQPYHVIRVSFRQEGGGHDFEDEYIYWIHEKKHTMDYFAYSYHTDGGGARFREAINRTRKGGIIFQDYVNYDVPGGTDLTQAARLFEDGRLRELSQIRNENLQVKKLRPLQ